jgi:hypothetical protein
MHDCAVLVACRPRRNASCTTSSTSAYARDRSEVARRNRGLVVVMDWIDPSRGGGSWDVPVLLLRPARAVVISLPLGDSASRRLLHLPIEAATRWTAACHWQTSPWPSSRARRPAGRRPRSTTDRRSMHGRSMSSPALHVRTRYICTRACVLTYDRATAGRDVHGRRPSAGRRRRWCVAHRSIDRSCHACIRSQYVHGQQYNTCIYTWDRGGGVLHSDVFFTHSIHPVTLSLGCGPMHACVAPCALLTVRPPRRSIGLCTSVVYVYVCTPKQRDGWMDPRAVALSFRDHRTTGTTTLLYIACNIFLSQTAHHRSSRLCTTTILYHHASIDLLFSHVPREYTSPALGLFGRIIKHIYATSPPSCIMYALYALLIAHLLLLADLALATHNEQ